MKTAATMDLAAKLPCRVIVMTRHVYPLQPANCMVTAQHEYGCQRQASAIYTHIHAVQ
jgi:hypothetical protein